MIWTEESETSHTTPSKAEDKPCECGHLKTDHKANRWSCYQCGNKSGSKITGCRKYVEAKTEDKPNGDSR